MQVLGIAGPSGSGKTTLIERLVPRLVDEHGGDERAGAARVATVKSIHHDVEVDEPGKDTHRHRVAGAGATVGVTPTRTFGFLERGKSTGFGGAAIEGASTDTADADGAGDRDEATVLEPILSGFADRGVEYALVEGFAPSALPKVAVGDAAERAVAEPIVARVDDGGTADLDALVDAIEGVRACRTAASVLEHERRFGPGATVAVASATSTRMASHQDWTHGRIEGPLGSIRDDLRERLSVERVTVHLRPPVSPRGEAAVHVAVGDEDSDRALAAVGDAGDRLAASPGVDGPVEYVIREE